MKLSKPKQFLIVLAAFLVLGIPFKVMVLVEGFTEVRPVNAIPPVAGMICGFTGALACGIGNLIADLFGTFNTTSLLGFVGNFAAAYLSYRLWHIYSAEEPNLHKNMNILRYVLVSFNAALSVSWFLGLGLFYFFGTWVEQVYTYIFYNNFGFSIGLGMAGITKETRQGHVDNQGGPIADEVNMISTLVSNYAGPIGTMP